MKILKGYQFRIYPTKEQEILINKTIGASRYIYNHFLEENKNEYQENKKSKNAYEQIKELPNLLLEYPWLKEVDSCSIRNSIFNLEDAYKRFYKGSGYPKFKKKSISGSYKTNNIKNTYKGKNYESIKLDLINKIITLPKLKEVKMKGYRNIKEIKGKIKSAIIRRICSKYYASVLIEEEIIKPEFIPTNIVGIDLGIKNLIITSNHEAIENTLKVKNYHKRIKGLQKALSRTKPGSKNRYKIKLKIQRVYLKIRNIRKYKLHEITNKIVKENDIIITEELNIKNMKQNHSIAKQLTDIPLYEIIRLLKYKCEWQNKKLIQIDKYYPSSQICSRCGYKNNKLKDIRIREWICLKCLEEHDRDYNASENILFEGIKKYMKELAI